MKKNESHSGATPMEEHVMTGIVALKAEIAELTEDRKFAQLELDHVRKSLSAELQMLRKQLEEANEERYALMADIEDMRYAYLFGAVKE